MENSLSIWFWLGFLPVGTIGGILVGYFARKVWAAKQLEGAEARLQKALDEARQKEKDILFGAKEKALTLIEEAKSEETSRRRQIDNLQGRLEKRKEKNRPGE